MRRVHFDRLTGERVLGAAPNVHVQSLIDVRVLAGVAMKITNSCPTGAPETMGELVRAVLEDYYHKHHQPARHLSIEESIAVLNTIGIDVMGQISNQPSLGRAIVSAPEAEETGEVSGRAAEIAATLDQPEIS